MRRTSLRVTATVLSVTAVGAVFLVPTSASAAGTLTVRGSDRSGGYIRSHAPGSTASENVRAVFTVPTASCSALPASGGQVTIGAGVDGTVRYSKVRLQAGVLIGCASKTAAPKYQIFWAQAPTGPRILGTTKPGHEIYVFVSSDADQPVNVNDNTTDVLYSGSTFAYATDHSSVQCLVGATLSRAGAVLPMPAFGTVTFTSCLDFGGPTADREVADPASARSGESTYQVRNDIGHVRATTSARKANGSWGVTWVAAS